MARSRDSRRRRGRRGGQPRAASAAAPRPSRALRSARDDGDDGSAADGAVAGQPAAVEAAALPARPRREIASSRPTTPDAPRVRGWFYRLTHPQAVISIIDELRKVVWPSRQETANLTVVVLVVAIAVGIFLGAIDFGLNRVVEEALLP